MEDVLYLDSIDSLAKSMIYDEDCQDMEFKYNMPDTFSNIEHDNRNLSIYENLSQEEKEELKEKLRKHFKEKLDSKEELWSRGDISGEENCEDSQEER